MNCPEQQDGQALRLMADAKAEIEALAVPVRREPAVPARQERQQVVQEWLCSHFLKERQQSELTTAVAVRELAALQESKASPAERPDVRLG